MKGLCALALLASTFAMAAPVRRVAVVVGANAAATGRAALRFADADAREVAEVLERAGQFAPEDIFVLIDPDPANVLATIDSALEKTSRSSGETLFLFYYSGHADDRALYPKGKPLLLDALRTRLESSSATVRLGIIDACRGGGWTQTKGLTPTPPFAVSQSFELKSEGSVLISSSSGLENAHESEAIGGSFFTHHLVAGLRGAADQSADGEVTIAEAYAYARQFTVRDTAINADSPQHPSFQLNLRGQKDLALTQLRSAPGVLTVQQSVGPLRLVRLPSGQVMTELPAGERTASLAVPPGTYLLTRRADDGVFVREFTVVAGVPQQIFESSLERSSRPLLTAKRFVEEPLSLASTAPEGRYAYVLQSGVVHISRRVSGYGTFDPYSGTPSTSRRLSTSIENQVRLGLNLQMLVGVTDRVQLSLPIPAVTWRLGTAGEREFLVWGGAVGGLQATSTDLSSVIGAGVDGRQYFGTNKSIGFGLRAKSGAVLSFDGSSIGPTTWIAEAGVSFSATLAETVTFNLGVAMAIDFLKDGSPTSPAFAFGLGSILERGTRQLPVLQVHLNEQWSLDLYVTFRHRPASSDTYDAYLLGVGYTQ